METKDFSVHGYLQHLQERKLMASRCNDCGALYLPPRPICPACYAQKMAWEELEGQGTVTGVTSIAIVPTGMAAKGFGRDNPYLTGIVTLKEGPGVSARIEATDADGVEREVEVGTPVRADFLEETEGEDTRVTLVFRPT